MSDDVKQPRAENGQFVSLTSLFERERVEHMQDHDRERAVARETAQRLEREVEETARRLERAVEETAIRLEKQVHVALQAVGGTALVHSEAHAKEHVAHERIHLVEKQQVDRADTQREQVATALAEQLKEFKTTSNEWRSALSDQRSQFVSRELFDVLAEKHNAIEKRVAYYAGGAAMLGALAATLVRLLTGE